MARHRVKLMRLNSGIPFAQTLGTTGLIAISAVSGVENARVESEDEDQVEISYEWTGAEKMQTIQEHLQAYGLARAF